MVSKGVKIPKNDDFAHYFDRKSIKNIVKFPFFDCLTLERRSGHFDRTEHGKWLLKIPIDDFFISFDDIYRRSIVNDIEKEISNN